MNAPQQPRRRLYVHHDTGWTFLEVRRGIVISHMQRVDPADGWAWMVPTAMLADRFTRVDEDGEPVAVEPVADDIDMPVPYRVAGVQPAVEFTAGPVGYGPWWTDEHLAALVARWAREDAR
jgi:hypothetical protein